MISKLVIIFAIVLSIIILVLVVLLSKKGVTPSPSVPIQIFSPNPTSSPISTSITAGGFTPQEQQYSEGTPLPPTSLTSKETGGLVVTSDPSGARVLIDPIDEEKSGEAPLPSGSPQNIPVKVTPFKVSSMPAGTHTIKVFKQDYVEQTVNFEVKASQITRLDLKLTPLP